MIGHKVEFDPLFHFSGGVAGAFALWRAFEAFPAMFPYRTVRHRGTLTIGVMLIAVLLWEFAEFTSDRFLGTHTQHGSLDTWTDVVLDMTGAITAMVVAWIITLRKQSSIRI